MLSLSVRKTRQRSGLTKIQAVVILVIILVAAVAGVTFAISQPKSVSIGVATTTDLGTANVPIEFTVVPTPSSATVKSVSWNFGDGTTQTTTGAEATHSYASGGSYLIEANASVSYTSSLLGYTATASDDSALIHVQVQSNLSSSVASETSIPSIGLPTATNPGAPVFSTGQTVAPVGGFLQPPTNSNYTIQSYTWNFGNGVTKTIPANSSTSEPTTNFTTSYSKAGLYPVTLTVTTNDSAGATANASTTDTLAVKSSARLFALLSSQAGQIVNPGVITLAEAGGSPVSLDPDVDYDDWGQEVIMGIYQPLVQYNGSSTDTFLPVAAATLPTVANGGISDNNTVYNFTIRSGVKFSNGDPVTAYDAWYNFMRAYALASGPTASWVLDQFLIPGEQNGTASYSTNNTYANAVKTITYSNASDTIEFHFNRSMDNVTVFQILAEDFDTCVMDPAVIKAAGAGWTQANWNTYAQTSEPTDFNTNLQWNLKYIVGSGPFEIKAVTPDQTIELVPNPSYTPTPGIPAPTDDIVIDWLSNPNTALLMLQDGQADSAVGIPTSDYPVLEQMESQGAINIYNFPTLSPTFYQLNIDINKTLESSEWGTSYNEPSNYFADLPTRYVWLDSYDYAGYISNILGNAKYNTTFGTPYQGMILNGESFYVPPSELGGVPQQNLAWAKGNFSESAWKDDKINIEIGIFVIGPQGELQAASAEEWAQTLSSISGGNITATVQIVPGSLGILGFQSTPLLWAYATPDYPSGEDYGDLFYLQGGFTAPLEGWTEANFTSLPPNNTANLIMINGKGYTQGTVWSWLQGNESAGDIAVTAAQKAQDYFNMEYLAVKMGIYLYQDQMSGFWFWRTWLGGIQNEEGPMLPGGGFTYLFWLTKPG